RGRIRSEERGVNLVDRREGREVGHVDGYPQRPRQGGSGRLADCAEILQAAARLLCRRLADELAGGRVERDLTRAEEQLAKAHGVAVGADGLWRLRRRDDLASRRHLGREPIRAGPPAGGQSAYSPGLVQPAPREAT